MTDAAQDTKATEPKPDMNQEQLHAVRDHIHSLVKSKYNELVSAIMSQPLPDQAFMQALLYLDTGMLWVKEAVYFAPFVQKGASPAVTPPPAANNEGNAEAPKAA